MPSKPFTIFAPAKINLSLYVTGKRADGYHTLDSIVSFADIGDTLEIAQAHEFSFAVVGEFASALQGGDLNDNNLVVRAAKGLAELAQKPLDISIALTKNLPLGAGLGGGSSDAAACIWGLMEHWDLPRGLDGLDALLLSLGADVPACFACYDLRMRGIGEDIAAIENFPELPIVLIYPNKPCETARIFSLFEPNYEEPPEHIADIAETIRESQNMLEPAASSCVPDITYALNALRGREGLDFARMSGSGSTCFGVFENEAQAHRATETIAQENPDWWVKPAWLGRTQRY